MTLNFTPEGILVPSALVVAISATGRASIVSELVPLAVPIKVPRGPSWQMCPPFSP